MDNVGGILYLQRKTVGSVTFTYVLLIMVITTSHSLLRSLSPPHSLVDGEQAVAMEEEMETSSEEDDGMCSPGSHKWTTNVCMVCKSCGHCTGYGPGCCNERSPGRLSGRLEFN